MEATTKRISTIATVAIGVLLLLIVIAVGLFGLVTATATVSGTASLPNGATAKITGPFSCSENKSLTKIEAGGHTFAFSPTTMAVDGAVVGPLDATMTDVQIEAGSWSAALRVNGREIFKSR